MVFYGLVFGDEFVEQLLIAVGDGFYLLFDEIPKDERFLLILFVFEDVLFHAAVVFNEIVQFLAIVFLQGKIQTVFQLFIVLSQLKKKGF